MTLDELIGMTGSLYCRPHAEWVMHPSVAPYIVYSLSRRLPYREWKRVWKKGK